MNFTSKNISDLITHKNAILILPQHNKKEKENILFVSSWAKKKNTILIAIVAFIHYLQTYWILSAQQTQFQRRARFRVV